ncbi:sterile alpha motif domain-containing protein 3-like [Haliotis cracherodii]|uniref:sterile alpha motif domain-containing protein 3-like n=1 Tax=Haliotis cracherodii TaxID=6455 RepID=UPI0039E8A9EB
MEKRFLLLQYYNSSKKVVFSGALTLNLVSENIRAKFRITSFTAKYWDKDVEDFVDLEESSIEDLQEDRVIKVRVFPNPNAEVAGVTMVTTLNQEREHREPPRDEVQPSSGMLVEVQQVKMETDAPRTSEEAPPNSQGCMTPADDGRLESAHELPNRKPWPKTYVFPSAACPRSLLQKLETQEPLEKRDISLLKDILYKDASLYEGGLYPSVERYSLLVDTILSTFPYLAKQGEDMPLHLVRVYWREKLKQKWGNERKVRDRDRPEVQARTRKRKSEPSEEPASKRVNLTWGLANFLPPPLPSEDSESIEAHVDWLQREFKKTAPCMPKVYLKMNLTFPERRRNVITQGLGVGDLLLKYPWLHQREQLLTEFSRLEPNTACQNMDDLLMDGFSKYHDSITRLAKGRKMPRFQRDFYEEMLLLRIDSQRKYSSQCAAVLGLGTLFKEKMEKVVKVKDTPDGEMAIQLIALDKISTTSSGAFQVHLEGHLVFVGDTFMQAVAGLMAAIYTFNLAYPKECEKTFLFIQKIVLRLADDEQVDKRIVSVLAQIQKERNNSK